MHTVHAPVSRFNPSTPGLYTADGGRIASYTPRNGFADELSPAGMALADEAADDRNAVLAEMEADRAIQAADESHAAELRAAFSRAKELAGNCRVKIGRQITIDEDSPAAATWTEWVATADTTWFAIIDSESFGSGVSPAAAVDAALAALDRRHGIARRFTGYTAAGTISVLGFPHRPAADALAMVRRVAVSPAYLATVLALPGVSDERPTPAVAAVA